MACVCGDDASRCCASCRRVFDVALILPCSHTLCARCLAEGAGPVRGGGAVRGVASASRPICAVLCPNCRHSVELPCFDWSSALTCLPFDPTVTPDPEASEETDGSVDLSEEEMERSVTGLVFALDSSRSDSPLRLSGSALSVSVSGQVCSEDERDDPPPLPQVCGSVSVSRGQYYWEIDVCNSALYRIGVISSCDGRGWWLERRGLAFHAVFDGRRELLPFIPPQLKTVGVFLNVGGASITFHNPVTQEFLAAVPSHFSVPLRPALQLGQGRLKLRPGLPPPNHVFLSPSSTYRGPGGAGSGRWRRGLSFGSVRAVVQKFEEMSTVSDSDSGLVSSVGSLSEHNTSAE